MLQYLNRLCISKSTLSFRSCVSVAGVQDKNTNLALSDKFANHQEDFQKIVTANPQLKKAPITLWETYIDTLQQFDFNIKDCLNILQKEPQVLYISNNMLLSVVHQWHTCSISNELMKLLLINRPELLFLPPVNVEKRLPILEQFVSNQKSLTMLLLQCPNILTEQWESVQAKIDYLANVMNCEKSDIISSSALNKSIEHIKLRHTLLEKCGMYVTPSPYEHKRIKNDKSAFRNPPLKRIVDNEDISFAKKICKISPEEYDVYKAIFEEGLRSNGEYNSGSDDSDSE